MSTLKVSNIQHENTSDGGISIDSSGHVSVEGQSLPSAGTLGNRNLVINGAMRVAQRGTSISLAQNTAYTLDKFQYHVSAVDTYTCTVARSSTAPAGFTRSLQLTTGTAETLASDEFVYISHKIEAQNLQHLQFGTAAAQSVTLSFWVRSSQTGTFGITLYQSDGNDLVNSTYTISTADTWERKTITFPGNTAASPANDNGEGFRISWILGAGSQYTGTSQTTWGAYSDAAWGGDHAQNGVVTTASATWYLTGVQLEVGTVATPFEHRSFGDELESCQRYYFNTWHAKGRSNAGAGGNTYMGVRGIVADITGLQGNRVYLPTRMRDEPSITIYRVDGSTGTSGECQLRAFDETAFTTTTAVSAQERTQYDFRWWHYTGTTTGSAGESIEIHCHFEAASEL